MEASAEQHHPTASPSPGRKRLFRVIGSFLPLAAILLVELALRAFGWGGHPPLLRELARTSEGRLMVVDPASSESYFFAGRHSMGGNARFVFPMPKPTNTVRVFLFGGSAIKGFPQPRHLTPTSFLQAMLEDIWPEQNVEVINFGTTAVASFPVRDMLEQALSGEPDLVVVYSGHNEFYGAFGAASSNHAGSRPWMQRWNRRIQSLAIVQAVRAAVSPPQTGEAGDLMQIMVGQATVPADHWRREAAVRTLSRNLRRMVQACERRDIPVILCTLPSNERDLAPIGIDSTPVVGSTAAADLESTLMELLEASPHSAQLHYALGRLLHSRQVYSRARDHFIIARDLDPMPWRATSSLQEVIHQVALDEEAILCDVEEGFRRLSPGGSIGWELMDDHVHPTERGQALIAELILRTMTNVPSRVLVRAEDLDRLRSWESYSSELGGSAYDRYTVARWMKIIFAIPFMKDSNPAAYERFSRLTSDFEEDQPPEIRTILQQWDTRLPINVAVAGQFIQQGHFEKALPLLRSAKHSVSPWSAASMEAVYNEMGCWSQIHGDLDDGRRQRALEEIERGRLLVESGVPETWIVQRTIGRLHLLREEYEAAVPDLLKARPHVTGWNRVVDDRALIRAYTELGQFEKARDIGMEGATSGGPYANLYLELLSGIPKATNVP